MLISKGTNLFECTRSNSTFRFIHDTFKANIIRRIGNQVQVRNDVTNFFTAIELGTSNHGIRNIRLEQGFFNSTRLSIGTVEDCKVFKILTFFTNDIINRRSYENSFITLVISTVINDLFTVIILSPKFLRTAITIVLNHLVGCLENLLSRTVIFFQKNYLGFGIIFLKIKNILHVSPTPTVD